MQVSSSRQNMIFAKRPPIETREQNPSQEAQSTDGTDIDWKSIKNHAKVGANIVASSAIMAGVGGAVLGIFGNGLGIPTIGVTVGAVAGGAFGAVVGGFSSFEYL